MFDWGGFAGNLDGSDTPFGVEGGTEMVQRMLTGLLLAALVSGLFGVAAIAGEDHCPVQVRPLEWWVDRTGKVAQNIGEDIPVVPVYVDLRGSSLDHRREDRPFILWGRTQREEVCVQVGDQQAETWGEFVNALIEQGRRLR